MPGPVVSVVIPVYNCEKYVGAMLESVLAQTFRDFEVVVVDDGSTDRSIDICKSATDSRVRYVRQENRGLAGARNTGVRNSWGKYIAFINADDMWAPGKLEKHVACLERSPRTGLSYSYSVFIDEHGRRTGNYQMRGRSPATADECLIRSPVGNGSNAVLRSEVLVGTTDGGSGGGLFFDEELRHAADYELWVRIAATTDWKIECIPWPLTYYRMHGGSLSSHTMRQRHYHMLALTKIYAYAPGLVDRCRTRSIAYLYWHLARVLVEQHDAKGAREAVACAVRYEPSTIRIDETAITCAALLLSVLPRAAYCWCNRIARRAHGRLQQRLMARQQARW